MDAHRRAGLLEAYHTCDPEGKGEVEVHVLLRRLKHLAEWEMVDELRKMMQTQQRFLTLTELYGLADAAAAGENLAVSETTSEQDQPSRGPPTHSTSEDSDSDERYAQPRLPHRRNVSARVTRVQSRAESKRGAHRRALSTPVHGGVATPLVGLKHRQKFETHQEEPEPLPEDPKEEEEKPETPVAMAVAVLASPRRGNAADEKPEPTETKAGPAAPPPADPGAAAEREAEANQRKHHRSPSPFQWIRGKLSKSNRDMDAAAEEPPPLRRTPSASAPPQERGTSYSPRLRHTAAEAKPSVRGRQAPASGEKTMSHEEYDSAARRRAHARAQSLDPWAAHRPPKTPSREGAREQRRRAQSMSHGHAQAPRDSLRRQQQLPAANLGPDFDRARRRHTLQTESESPRPHMARSPAPQELTAPDPVPRQPRGEEKLAEDELDPIAGRLRLHGPVGNRLERMMATQFDKGHVGEQDLHLLRTHAPRNTGGQLQILWEGLLDKKGTTSIMMGFHHRYVVLYGASAGDYSQPELRWYKRKVDAAWGPLPIEERGSIPLSRVDAVEPLLQGKAQRSFVVRLTPEHTVHNDQDAADENEYGEDFENVDDENYDDYGPNADRSWRSSPRASPGASPGASPRRHGKSFVRTHSEKGNHAPSFTFRAATGLQAKLWILVLKGFVDEMREAA